MLYQSTEGLIIGAVKDAGAMSLLFDVKNPAHVFLTVGDGQSMISMDGEDAGTVYPKTGGVVGDAMIVPNLRVEVGILSATEYNGTRARQVVADGPRWCISGRRTNGIERGDIELFELYAAERSASTRIGFRYWKFVSGQGAERRVWITCEPD